LNNKTKSINIHNFNTTLRTLKSTKSTLSYTIHAPFKALFSFVILFPLHVTLNFMLMFIICMQNLFLKVHQHFHPFLQHLIKSFIHFKKVIFIKKNNEWKQPFFRPFIKFNYKDLRSMHICLWYKTAERKRL